MAGFNDDFDTTLRSERELADLQAQANAPVTPTEADPGTWVRKDTFTAKGDLPVATAAANIGRQPVGSNGQVLTADSSTTTGVKWATPSSGITNTAPANNVPKSDGANLVPSQIDDNGNDITLSAANDVVLGSSALIRIDSIQNLILLNMHQLPIADPGVTGAVWMDVSNFLKVSP